MSNNLDSVGLVWVQTVFKDYQQTTKVVASRERFNKHVQGLLNLCFTITNDM